MVNIALIYQKDTKLLIDNQLFSSDESAQEKCKPNFAAGTYVDPDSHVITNLELLKSAIEFFAYVNEKAIIYIFLMNRICGTIYAQKSNNIYKNMKNLKEKFIFYQYPFFLIFL